MRIDQTTIDKVLEKADIVEVIGEHVKLEKKGNDYKGLCPFHNDNNPSFSVSPNKKVYKCFSCNEAGNVVKFIQKIKNVSFLEAIKILGDKYNIPVDLKDNGFNENLRKYYDIMSEATNAYEFYLKNTKEGEVALNYLHNRNLNDEIIKQFKIGLSSEKENILCKALIESEKYTPLDLKEIHLIDNRNDKYFDLFHGRIMFPIKNLNGNVVGFSGRLYKEGKPKYINSNENIIFKKGQILYNYSECYNDIKLLNNVFVFEGFMDVIAAYRCGIKNAVATMGTALTNNQIAAIKKLTSNVVICYDGDNAGIEATKRAIRLFINAKFNVKVILMPDGLDPDEYINKFGNEALNNYLNNNALSCAEYLYEIEKKNLNLNDSNSILNFQNNVYTFLKFFNSKSLESLILNKMSTDLGLDKQDLTKDLENKTASNEQDYSISNLDYQNFDYPEFDYPTDFNSNNLKLNNFVKLKYSQAENALIYFSYHRKDDCDKIKNLLGFKGSFTTNHRRNILYKLYDYYSFSNTMDSNVFFKTLNNEEYNELNNIINSYNIYSQGQIEDFVNVVVEYSNEKNIQDIKNNINNGDEIDDKILVSFTKNKRITTKIKN